MALHLTGSPSSTDFPTVFRAASVWLAFHSCRQRGRRQEGTTEVDERGRRGVGGRFLRQTVKHRAAVAGAGLRSGKIGAVRGADGEDDGLDGAGDAGPAMSPAALAMPLPSQVSYRWRSVLPPHGESMDVSAARHDVSVSRTRITDGRRSVVPCGVWLTTATPPDVVFHGCLAGDIPEAVLGADAAPGHEGGRVPETERVEPPSGESSPLVLAGLAMRLPAMPSPEKIVFTYDPDEFERFVEEWVPALNEEYVRVVRQGGTGDHGIDVAGYLTPQALEGDWHNYQCKRYKGPLTWSIAAAEIRKMFAGAALGYFTVPSRYVFVAPQIGRGLRQDLDRPNATRTKFLDELEASTDPVITALSSDARRTVEKLATSTSFAMFGVVDMATMLAQHRRTPHWFTRFPPDARERPPAMKPPQEHASVEARYVRKLVQVYAERWGEAADTLNRVRSHDSAAAHLRGQREAFFSAESLRLFARDAYPRATSRRSSTTSTPSSGIWL